MIKNKKVLITTSSFGKFNDLPLNLFNENNIEYILNPYKRKLKEEELLALLNEHSPDYLLAGTEVISENTLNKAKTHLKAISRCGVGMDSVDLEAAKELSIPVYNTPDAPTKPVAELTLGIILDLLRKISFCDRDIRNSGFKKPMGNLLHGKTVGIIGCGRIGSHLAKLLEPFECNLIGFDSFIKKHSQIKMVTFEELLKNSDIVSLHIPFSKENRNLIDKKAFDLMKNSAYIINVARGGIIDENDLINALKANKIAGAGIDCYKKEPYSGDLTTFDNVVLTSHIGSYAVEARVQQERDSVNNILKFHNGDLK